MKMGFLLLPPSAFISSVQALGPFLFPTLVGSVIKSISFSQENSLKEKMFCLI